MIETKQYNGWTNYETWNVKLWMDNDEGSYHHWQEQATEVWAAAEASDTYTRSEDARSTLAERLKDQHQQTLDELNLTGFASDLLGSALSEVNWHEIADSLLRDVDDDDEDEDATEEADTYIPE